MKKLVWLMVCLLPCVPGAMAQEFNHFQVGAFADYFRSNDTGTNMFGLGGRFGVTVLPHVRMEAEMAYDFDKEFSEGFTSTSSGGTVSFANTGVLEAKGGFVNFMFDSAPPGFDSFANQVGNLRAHNWNGAFMPGGGVETTLGPVGLRLDVGDEMYFSNGTHHNLKVMFGPYIRF
jgi:hypothetical protein